MFKFAALLTLAFSAAHAMEGSVTRIGGAGDAIGFDFFQVARSELPYLDNSGLAADKLELAHTLLVSADPKEHLTVFVQENVYLRDVGNDRYELVDKTAYDDSLAKNDHLVREASAANFASERLLYVSASRWRDLQYAQKLALAMHEMLGLLGVPDNDYALSAKLLPPMDESHPKPLRPWNDMAGVSAYISGLSVDMDFSVNVDNGQLVLALSDRGQLLRRSQSTQSDSGQICFVFGSSGNWVAPGDGMDGGFGRDAADNLGSICLQRSAIDDLLARGKADATISQLGPFGPTSQPATVYLNSAKN